MRVFLFISLFCLLMGTGAYGQEAGADPGGSKDTGALSLEDFDFTEIQSFMEDNFSDDLPGFRELVESLLRGDIQPSMKTAGEYIGKMLTGEIRQNRKILARIMILAVSAALFSNIASVFRDNQISQNAWFVIYLMLSGTLLAGFSGCYQESVGYLEKLLTFVKLLVPAFSLALSCICGAAAMSVWYQLTFLLITLIDWLFLYLLLPGIKVYVCLYLLNELTGEDYLSGFLELLQMLFEWLVKTISGVVVGMQVVQGLILPAVGQMKGQLVNKLIQAVPGIGSGVRSASEILLGTGVLIKNGIGAAGCLVIGAICLLPLLQLGVIVVMYYAVGAVIQPVSDAKVKNCIMGTAYGIRMLLKAVAISAFLFAVSVALICVFTNRVF